MTGARIERGSMILLVAGSFASSLKQKFASSGLPQPHLA
jgi:hypothetical protein